MAFTRRIFTAGAASVGVLPFVGVASAAHQHQPAHQLLGNKLNTDGKHELHKRGDHTVYAHVQGKKISHISVAHKTKGEVAVKKFKTNKKVVQLGAPNLATEETSTVVEPVSYQVAQQIVWMVGWAYDDAGNQYYYWFPAEMVIDPFTGAIDYVPLA